MMSKVKTTACIAAIFMAPFMHGMSEEQNWANLREMLALGRAAFPSLPLNIPKQEAAYLLLLAAQEGDLVFVEGLLPYVDSQLYEHITLARTKKRTPLHQAAQNGHFDVVKALVKGKANIAALDDENCTPLTLASEVGLANIVMFLLNNTPKNTLFIRTKQGNTALEQAAQEGKDGAVELLLQHGGPEIIDLQNNQGITPIWRAAHNGHTKTVEILIEAKANVAIPNEFGFLPLHMASQLGHLTIAEKLLEKAPDSINACTDFGSTPLHFACNYVKRNMVGLLLLNKADVTRKNKGGYIPLNCTTNGEIREMLIKHSPAHTNLRGISSHVAELEGRGQEEQVHATTSEAEKEQDCEERKV